MKSLLLIAILWSGGLWASTLIVFSQESTIEIDPYESSETWLDQRTPSCDLFVRRKTYYRKQNEEISSLLEAILRKRNWTDKEVKEYAALKQRKLSLNRELAQQKLLRQDLFDISGLDETLQFALKNGDFQIHIDLAGLKWRGFDHTVPDGLQLEVGESSLRIKAEINLSDFCSQDGQLWVKLIIDKELEGEKESPNVVRTTDL